MKQDPIDEEMKEVKTEPDDKENQIPVCKHCGESQIIQINLVEMVRDCFFNGFTLAVQLTKGWLEFDMRSTKQEIDQVVIAQWQYLVKKYTLQLKKKVN